MNMFEIPNFILCMYSVVSQIIFYSKTSLDKLDLFQKPPI